MKIAFYEIQAWEEQVLKKCFEGHELRFFPERLEKENASNAKDCDILSVFVHSDITKQILSKMPNLKYLTTRSMGIDHIDLKACRKERIKVSNAPHYGDSSVAEHTFALLLAISRNVHKAYVRNLNEDHSIEGLKGFDLKGKTIGVIGVGRIGTNVVKIAKGFQMNVIAHNHHVDKKLAKKLGFKYVSFEELIRSSDVITLHVPYVRANHHLINERAFKKMKRGAILINTSRGPIVDTKDLKWALDSGILAGAGLDVIEGEDLITEEKEFLHNSKKLNPKKMWQLLLDHQLFRDDKVVFTPHIAFYSEEAIQRILNVTIDNIQSFIKNKPINLI